MKIPGWASDVGTNDGDEMGAGRGEEGGVSRSRLLRRVAVGLGSFSAGGALAATLASASGSAALSGQDRAVLEFALTLEHLQVAFYTQAARTGAITGEAHQFAEVVGAEERAHLGYLRGLLGSAGAASQTFTFGDALAGSKSFIAAAAAIEETGIAAYNGQATNLSPGVLSSVARVISVEARHAAWARALAGEQPAPVAVDVPISVGDARTAIARYVA